MNFLSCRQASKSSRIFKMEEIFWWASPRGISTIPATTTQLQAICVTLPCEIFLKAKRSQLTIATSLFWMGRSLASVEARNAEKLSQVERLNNNTNIRSRIDSQTPPTNAALFDSVPALKSSNNRGLLFQENTKSFGKNQPSI